MMSMNVSSDMDQIMMVSMEQLVPEKHLLRKIASIVDFSFVYEKCEKLYSDVDGRPSIDPVVLVKLALIQKLFGIRSMRQTIREVEVNVAYRWFLGYNLVDSIPHFGTFSKNYIRRFKDSDVFESLFGNVLELCIRHAKVDTSVLFVDSTHVKACANRRKNHKEEIEKAAAWYKEELMAEISRDRESHGKKPLKPSEKIETSAVTVSETDSESGLFRKGEHKEVFAYSVQTACDKNAFIVEYSVHPGNEHDSKTFPVLYNKVKKYRPEMMVMYAGYKNAAIAHILLENGIEPLFPYTRPMGRPGEFSSRNFLYDEYNDCVLCPMNKILKYSTTNRDGYREYKSDRNECSQCPRLRECTGSRDCIRLITRHVWQDDLERCDEIRYREGSREIYALRKETIERDFGLAKETMGFRYTMQIGKRSMEINAALTYAALNLKKLVGYLERTGVLDSLRLKNMLKKIKIHMNIKMEGFLMSLGPSMSTV